MPPLVLPRGRRVGVAVGVVAVLVLLLLSHSFGRAVPTNNYRPLLPPDALATGCFPLPGGADLEFAHQIRRDGDVETPTGARRQLDGQFDLVGRDEAVEAIVAAFVEVGFSEVSREDDGDSLVVELRDGDETVGVRAAEFSGIDADTLVRGEFTLDLPVVAAALDDPVCDDPKSTKRWKRAARPTK